MNRQYKLAKRTVDEKPPFPSPAFILVSIILCMVGYGFYRFADYLTTESQMFQLKTIEVVGNRYIENDKIIRLAQVETGIRLFGISTDSIEARLMEYPYMRGVSVNRSFPSTLIIAVQEREPMAYLVDNKIYMVDPFGKILLKKPAMSLNNLPLITGLSVPKLLENRQPLYDALDIIRVMKEIDENLIQFISEIHIEREQPPELYLIRGGAVVNMGSGEFYSRLYLLNNFIQKPGVLNQLEHIKRIDLTFEDRIIVTRKS